jgi:hypothetical protein
MSTNPRKIRQAGRHWPARPALEDAVAKYYDSLSDAEAAELVL